MWLHKQRFTCVSKEHIWNESKIFTGIKPGIKIYITRNRKSNDISSTKTCAATICMCPINPKISLSPFFMMHPYLKYAFEQSQKS